jgi:hypothetical protein
MHQSSSENAIPLAHGAAEMVPQIGVSEGWQGVVGELTDIPRTLRPM